MDPSIIGGRYAVEGRAGAGGMGTVYRVRDQLTGRRVAVKVLSDQSAEAVARFAREIRALAAMRHPNIIEYIDHGQTEDGQPFLVMEWMEGEDLEARLARSRLSLGSALALAASAAAALGAAHKRGIVHRDLKPSNLFLPSSDVARVKLIDFGIARLAGVTSSLTRSGTAVGTPSYMAPEQARGDRDVDERADVFSLGCVLFECLTGRPPFVAAHPLAVLAKILFEDAPRPSDCCAGIPTALDELVALMLDKDREQQPSDASAIADELRSMKGGEGDAPISAGQPPQSIATRERRLVCVVLAAEAADGSEDAGGADPHAVTASDETDQAMAHDTAAARLPDVIAAIRKAALRHRARFEILRSGSVAAVVSGAEPTADLAARAARCAIAIRALLPGARVALATGWDVLAAGAQPVGEVIDRAGALLERGPMGPALAEGAVLLDRMSAKILEDRFVIAACEGEGAFTLTSEREPAAEARRLLGRLTTCVGRDRELSVLMGLFKDCVTEPRARAVLVTGPAGIGKSRVRMELLKRLSAEEEPAEVWFSRGDPMSAGSPFSMLAQLVRRAAGIEAGDAPQASLEKLREHVAARSPQTELARITEFLGELIGLPPINEESPQLAAARESPTLMGDQMRRAWDDFIAAECAAGPLVLVLEDLHWGDLPTLKLVDAALRNLPDRPLFVVAFARAEIHAVFPDLWQERGVDEIRLGTLTSRACESLVREVLTGAVDAERVSRIVALASGNAFFLEELIRAEAEGQTALPDTVLASVQVRLDGLPEQGRKLLRIASVFGKEFSASGLSALLSRRRVESLPAELSDLVSREILLRPADPRSAAARYVFRHSLLRDAAYATLTDSDRVILHRQAGEWLEGLEGCDAMTLAEHFERGRAPDRALPWYQRAAEHALEGDDLGAVFQRAERAIACGADGEVLGELRSLQAYAHQWKGELREAEARAAEAMRFLPKGSALWYRAAGQVIKASGWLGKYEDAAALTREVLELSSDGNLHEAALSAMADAVMRCCIGGRRDVVTPLSARLEAFATDTGPLEPTLSALIDLARVYRLYFLEGDVEGAIELLPGIVAVYEQAGDLRNACFAMSCLAEGTVRLGRYAETAELLKRTLARASRMGLTSIEGAVRVTLGVALARLGELAEARAMEAEAARLFARLGNRRMQGGAGIALAMVHLWGGDLDSAEEQARAAASMLESIPTMRVYAIAALAAVSLARGRVESAMGLVREMLTTVETEAASSRALVDSGGNESFIRLVQAETLRAAGELAAAEDAIRAARDRILARAAGIRRPEWRESFLTNLPDNARTLALAKEWLGEG